MTSPALYVTYIGVFLEFAYMNVEGLYYHTTYNMITLHAEGEII